jgi:homogentisate phytyltransferase/homogentisate geranylgeranyltransferase
MIEKLFAFWKFSRPHTLIGSLISVVTLYTILCQEDERAHHLDVLFWGLLIGICTNIFIVGINQIADVELDKINKPWLPIPAGELSIREAKVIVVTALVASLGISLYLTPYLFAVIVLSAIIGWAYSMPPLHLKKHHLTSAIAISVVRGVLVNLGGFIVISERVNPELTVSDNLKLLILFIIVFSLVISWFKDMPDVEGDARYQFRTLPVLYSLTVAFIAGNMLLIGAYLITIVYELNLFMHIGATQLNSVLLFGHLLLLILYMLNARLSSIKNRDAVQQFYKRFWLFFFAEYLLYLGAYW